MRRDATGLRIHQADANGVSRASTYAAVEVGDAFEWRHTNDCWISYRVSKLMPDPPGLQPRKYFEVEPVGYAYTGCSGSVTADAAVEEIWGEPPSRGGASLTAPVVYGIFQVVPVGWTGELDNGWGYDPPAYSFDSPVETRSLSEARKLPYWRDLPGWTLRVATSGAEDGPSYGYCATFDRGDGDTRDAVDVCGGFSTRRGGPSASSGPYNRVVEVRTINGYPAAVDYFSPSNHRGSPITVVIYDNASQGVYEIDGRSYSLLGDNLEAVLAIAKTLFPGTSGEPRSIKRSTQPAALRYDTYDTTGAVTTAGSYAFIASTSGASGGEGAPGAATANAAATTRVITTYEGLRSDATMLKVNRTDAGGTLRDLYYGAVGVGHLIEWRKADDCFVRYRVTDAPAAAAAYREFGVRPETYVFQGCQSGSLPAASNSPSGASSAVATFAAAEEMALAHLGGTRLSSSYALLHGVWEIYASTSVAHETDVLVPEGDPPHVPAQFANTGTVTSLTDARKFPYWREPTLPSGWRFHKLYVGGGGDLPPGYEAFFIDAAGDHALEIRGEHVVGRPIRREATWLTNVGERIVREPRTVAKRPAVVMYSPDGPQQAELFWARVDIYDAATETVYTVIGSARMGGGPAGLERVLAIARSLFEGTNPP